MLVQEGRFDESVHELYWIRGGMLRNCHMRGREERSIKDECAIFPFLKAYKLRTHDDVTNYGSIPESH